MGVDHVCEIIQEVWLISRLGRSPSQSPLRAAQVLESTTYATEYRWEQYAVDL
jgi:hypothetical protein